MESVSVTDGSFATGVLSVVLSLTFGVCLTVGAGGFFDFVEGFFDVVVVGDGEAVDFFVLVPEPSFVVCLEPNRLILTMCSQRKKISCCMDVWTLSTTNEDNADRSQYYEPICVVFVRCGE